MTEDEDLTLSAVTKWSLKILRLDMSHESTFLAWLQVGAAKSFPALTIIRAPEALWPDSFQLTDWT